MLLQQNIKILLFVCECGTRVSTTPQLICAPGGVVETVVVAKGHKEAEDGEKHDDVSGEDKHARAPVDDVVGSGEDDGEGEGGEDDARRDEVAKLPEGGGGVHVVRVATGEEGGERREEVEEDDEQRPPTVVLGQRAAQDEAEESDGAREGQAHQRFQFSSHVPVCCVRCVRNSCDQVFDKREMLFPVLFHLLDEKGPEWKHAAIDCCGMNIHDCGC